MPYYAALLFLFALISACVGFSGTTTLNSVAQLLFFAFLIASLAVAVFSRRTPI